MSNFLFLEPDLFYAADIAKEKIESRFNVKDAKKEEAFDSDINYVPTFHWKTKTHIIICEIASSPFPNSIKDFYSDILVKGMPVKVIVVYPEDRQSDIKKYRAEIKKAKEYGLGLLVIDSDNKIILENLGISIPLHIAQLNYKKYHKKFQASIEEAYETYMLDGKPDVALQKLGQLVENIILNMAIKAKRKGTFTFNGFTPGVYIPQNRLLSELIKENIVDVALLGNCKNFANDRNSVSHKAKSRKQAIEIEEKLRDSFNFGLRILETIPVNFKAKGFTIQV